MSANDHLHQRQFHGSASDITDRVLPAEQVGQQMWKGYRTSGGRPAKTVAFATTSENTAWRFAGQAAEHMQSMERDRRFAATGRVADYHSHVVLPRSRVYEVASHPEQEPGVNNAEHPNWKRNSRGGRENHREVIAPHFDVVGRHDIKPGHQGTFPQLNWNQFHVGGGGGLVDTNHPTHGDVEGGHVGSSAYKKGLEELYGTVEESKQHAADEAERTKTQMTLF